MSDENKKNTSGIDDNDDDGGEEDHSDENDKEEKTVGIISWTGTETIGTVEPTCEETPVNPTMNGDEETKPNPEVTINQEETINTTPPPTPISPAVNTMATTSWTEQQLNNPQSSPTPSSDPKPSTTSESSPPPPPPSTTTTPLEPSVINNSLQNNTHNKNCDDDAENDEKKKKKKVVSATLFLEEIKRTYLDNPGKYIRFLEIMRDFKLERISIPEIISQVKILFNDKPFLLEKFHAFLPESSSLQSDETEREEPQERTPAEYDAAKVYIGQIKQRFINEPDVYKSFLAILQGHHHKQKTIREVYTEVCLLFRNHLDLLEGFHTFLPPLIGGKESTDVFGDYEPISEPMSLAPKKRKRKTPSVELEPYKRRKTSKKKMDEKLVPSGNYDDLAIFFSVKKRLGDFPLSYFQFLKCLHLYSQRIFSKGELIILVSGVLDDHQDLMDKFKDFIGFDPEFDLQPPTDEDQNQDGHLPEIMRPTSGPSYRALPKDAQEEEKCSGRTPLCHEVLNETWSSAATGSEDFGLKLPNHHEEELFRCEDERFLVDLQIEQNLSTIRALESIETQLKLHGPNRLTEGYLNSTLDVINLRHIQHIFGQSGDEVLARLYSEPHVVVPILLSRLQKKDLHWCQQRQDFGVQWRKTMEKHQYRLNDTQSKDFIETDRASLNATFHRSSFCSPIRRLTITKCLDLLALSIKTVFSGTEDLQQKTTDFLKYFIRPFFCEYASCIFADSTFYLLFQILLTIHDRLEKARQLSANAYESTRFPIGNSWEEQQGLVPQSKETYRYFVFLRLLRELVHSGLLEVEEFQDDVFSLFGPEGYVLFTLDKLFVQASAKIRDLVSDDICSRLLSLHNSHTFDGYGESQHDVLKAALEILDTKSCFRIHYHISEWPGACLKGNKILFQDRLPDEIPTWSFYVGHSSNLILSPSESHAKKSVPWSSPVLLWRNLKKQDRSQRRIKSLSFKYQKEDYVTLEFCVHPEEVPPSHFHFHGAGDFLFKPHSLLKSRSGVQPVPQKIKNLERIFNCILEGRPCRPQRPMKLRSQRQKRLPTRRKRKR